MHTLIDLRGNIPTFIRISNGKLYDVNILDVYRRAQSQPVGGAVSALEPKRSASLWPR